MPLRMALWLCALIAVAALGYSGLRVVYDKGRESMRPELTARDQRIALLEAANTVANAEAIRRQQEATQAARAIEDEQRRRIEETTALVASYEAAAALGADERERRLRAALEARACRRDALRASRVSEAAAIESRSAEAPGLVVDATARNLREYGDGVERLNGQFTICYRLHAEGQQPLRTQ